MTDGDGANRRAMLTAPGRPLDIREVAVPNPAPGEVLVRIKVATVCALTDLHIMAGIHPPHASGADGMLPHDLRVQLGQTEGDPLSRLYPPSRWSRPVFPATMGHEASGVVAGLGTGSNDPGRLVFPDETLSIGDRVATYRVPAGYGDYCCIRSDNVVRVPDHVSDEEAALIEPLIPNYNCLRRCWSIQAPSTVAVLGQGFQGLVATQVVKALGAEHVIVSEPNAARRGLALELGADVALDPRAHRLAAEVERLTGDRGVDLVVECAGVEETIQVMPYLVRRGGMVAQLGGPEMPVRFDYGYVHFKHIMVVPSDYIRSLRDAAQDVFDLFRLMETGALRVQPLLTHRFELGDINRAFELLRSQSDGVVKVVIDL